MRLHAYPYYPRPMTIGEAPRPAKAQPEFSRLNTRQCCCQPFYVCFCHLAQEGQGQMNLFRRNPAGTLDFNPQAPQCHLEINGEFNGNEESHVVSRAMFSYAACKACWLTCRNQRSSTTFRVNQLLESSLAPRDLTSPEDTHDVGNFSDPSL